jgi:hypothetical protein
VCTHNQDGGADERFWLDINRRQATEANVTALDVVRYALQILRLGSLQSKTDDGWVKALRDHSLHNWTVELAVTWIGSCHGTIIDGGIVSNVGAGPRSKCKTEQSTGVAVADLEGAGADTNFLVFDLNSTDSDVHKIECAADEFSAAVPHVEVLLRAKVSSARVGHEER